MEYYFLILISHCFQIQHKSPPQAMFKMAEIYLSRSRGYIEDFIFKAAKLFLQADKNKFPEAKKRLDELLSQYPKIREKLKLKEEQSQIASFETESSFRKSRKI